MGIHDLLERLQGVKATGRDRWVARCPAHSDRNPSLSVRALADGRVLLHDFGGCDPGAVLDAVGLTFSDLFPEPLTREALPRTRGGISAHEALECLRSESAVLAILASDAASGKALDADRAALCAGRIASALEAAFQ
jgi:hypothetical protein